MRFFYDKNYYKNVYKTWTLKKAVWTILLFSFLISVLFVINLSSKFSKYTDIVFLKSFFNDIPKTWEIKNMEGLRVYNESNTEIFNFENKYLKLDLQKDVVQMQDFGDKNFVITKNKIAIKVKQEIQYLPIDNFNNIQDVNFKNLNILKIDVDNKNDKIGIFRDTTFVKNIAFSEIIQYFQKILNIFRIGAFFVVGIFIFLNIIFMFWMLSKIYAFVLKRKNVQIVGKQLFISFTPIMFVYSILFFVSKIIFNISIIPANIIFGLYTIFITFIFLKDLDS
jgi:hypothetical protein